METCSRSFPSKSVTTGPGSTRVMLGTSGVVGGLVPQPNRCPITVPLLLSPPISLIITSSFLAPPAPPLPIPSTAPPSSDNSISLIPDSTFSPLPCFSHHHCLPSPLPLTTSPSFIFVHHRLPFPPITTQMPASQDVELQQLDRQAFEEPLQGELGGCIGFIEHDT